MKMQRRELKSLSWKSKCFCWESSIFQFFSFSFRMSLRLSFLHRRPPGLASCAGGQDFFPKLLCKWNKAGVSILLSQVPFLSFYFSFFSCLFLLFLLQFSLSSTSFFSFFFAFKNWFGKLACQVATQVSYFRNALSFFATENFNPIFNVVFTSLSSVLFKLKRYLVKRQLKNYPTAKIKSI